MAADRSHTTYTTEMEDIDGVPDGWKLSYEEVSNNVYKVRLIADYGSVVELTDQNDFEVIVSCCIESAKDRQHRST